MTNTDNTNANNLVSLDYVSNPQQAAFSAAVTLTTLGFSSMIFPITGGYAVVFPLGVSKFIDNRVN
jgi:hypothetical protein